MYVDAFLQGFSSAETSDLLNSTMNAEVARQQGYDSQAWGIMNRGIATQGPTSAQNTLNQGAKTLSGGYKSAESTPYVSGGNTYGAEKSATTTGNISGYQSRTNATRSKNASWGDLATQQGINAQDTGSELGLVARRSANSAQALTAELGQASTQSNDFSNALAGVQGFDSSMKMYGSGVSTAQTMQNTFASSSSTTPDMGSGQTV